MQFDEQTALVNALVALFLLALILIPHFCMSSGYKAAYHGKAETLDINFKT